MGSDISEHYATRCAWLHFALDCQYISTETRRELTAGYEQASATLWAPITRWTDLS